MTREQQEECSEIHTMQIFREATSCLPSQMSNEEDRQSTQTHNIEIQDNASIVGSRDKVIDGIGGDWAIEMDKDIKGEPSASPEITLHPEGESSLYSFYFETALVSMSDDQAADDFTITSHETDGFHEQNNFNLDNMDGIWEQGLQGLQQSWFIYERQNNIM